MTTEYTLTETEISNLILMREEEKLARDVYLYLAETWNVKIFENIARAEQSHMDSVKVILDTYNISDPALSEQGKFADPVLQSLYDDLLNQGSVSLADALAAGALVEEVDIQDLYKTINETDNPDIIDMYTNLLNGSYKHLNAFTDQLTAQGVSYEPQILTTEIYNAILNGEDIAIPETPVTATPPTADEVAKLYVATFNRAPDVEGLSYWVNDSGLDLDGIAQSFFEQQETQELYPEDTSNEDFVTSVYANVFNRDPDESGFEYWVAELDAQVYSKNLFIQAVINGAQDSDITILQNKTDVGLYYAENDLNDITTAYEIMAGITVETRSVDNAYEFIDTIVNYEKIIHLSADEESSYAGEDGIAEVFIYEVDSNIDTLQSLETADISLQNFNVNEDALVFHDMTSTSEINVLLTDWFSSDGEDTSISFDKDFNDDEPIESEEIVSLTLLGITDFSLVDAFIS